MEKMAVTDALGVYQESLQLEIAIDFVYRMSP